MSDWGSLFTFSQATLLTLPDMASCNQGRAPRRVVFLRHSPDKCLRNPLVGLRIANVLARIIHARRNPRHSVDQRMSLEERRHEANSFNDIFGAARPRIVPAFAAQTQFVGHRCLQSGGLVL
jgi:hypothetical protein